MGRAPLVWVLRSVAVLATVAAACIPTAEGPLCPEGLHLCDERCVDLSQASNHCGACGRVCAEGERCEVGVCDGCAAGLTDCGDGCISLDASSEHCGGCGQACAPTQRCDNRECRECAASSLCGGRCVDVKRDPDHCGACDQACDGGRRCDAGSCVAACVDTPVGGRPIEVSCERWEATWVHHAATPGDDLARAVAFGDEGTVFAAGQMTSSLAPFGCETLPASSIDIWVTALRPSGSVAWCERLSGAGNQSVTDIVSLPSGGVMVTGYFRTELLLRGQPVCTGSSDEHAFALEVRADGTAGARFCDGRPAASTGQALAVGPEGAYLLGFEAAGAVAVGSNNATGLWVLRLPLGASGQVCDPVTSCPHWSATGEVHDAGDIVVRNNPGSGEPAVMVTSGYVQAQATGALPATLIPGDPSPDLVPGAVLLVGLDADLGSPRVASYGTTADCLDGGGGQARQCAVGRALLERGDRVVLLLDYRHAFVDGVDLPSPDGRDVGVVSIVPADLSLDARTPLRIFSLSSDVGVDLVTIADGFAAVAEVQGTRVFWPGHEEVKDGGYGLLVLPVDDELQVLDEDDFLLIEGGDGDERGGRLAYRQGLLVVPGRTDAPSLPVGDQVLYRVNNDQPTFDDAFVAAFAY